MGKTGALFFLVVSLLLSSHSLGQNPEEPAEASEKIILPLTDLEFNLSVIVLAFGLIITLLEVFLIKQRKISGEDSIKFITITLIIISTLFLITAGYSNNQIAPAVGLLGTIAGYLLGRINDHKKNERDENNM